MREMLVCFALLFAANTLSAQTKNDVGLSIGAVLQPSPGATVTQTTSQVTQVSFGSGLTFEANYSRSIASLSAFALELEAPLLTVPSETVSSQPRRMCHATSPRFSSRPPCGCDSRQRIA